MNSTPNNSRTVKHQLENHPYRFEFNQAVRLLQLMAIDNANPVVGEDGPPHREVIRFRALVSHTFPSSQIAGLEPSTTGKRPSEMTVAFLGMIGPSGVLPQHYTRLMIERVRERDYSLRDFFDLFHHRATSYFYRAWEKYQFAVAYESHRKRKDRDPYSNILFSAIGFNAEGLRKRFEFDDEGLLYYAGQLARQARCPLSLERILEDYFEVPIQVLQFQGQWLQLHVDEQTVFSGNRKMAQNHQLGVNTVVGERVWTVESKVRVRVGPLSFRDFIRFSPLSDTLQVLEQWTRTYIGADLDFDVQLVLRADEVPQTRLGDSPETGSHLGWTTWLGSAPPTEDADDAVFWGDGRPSR